MPKKKNNVSRSQQSSQVRNNSGGRNLKFDFLNTAQKIAWGAFQKHDVTFLIGPAGTGKTFLAAAFAIYSLIHDNKTKDKIILTRPIVEAGESLGYLPGDLHQKVQPYMMPIYDCMDELLKGSPTLKEQILGRTEIAPVAYMRGRTFNDSICIFDEAQNANILQLKLFLSRFGKNSKVIITGDPRQTDIGRKTGLMDVINRLEGIPGVGIVELKNNAIVRHPLIGEILDRLEDVKDM